MAWDVLSGVTKKVRGDKNSMGCFVRGGKSLWDVMSGGGGGGGGGGHGMFCPGMFCLAPVLIM